MFAEFGEAKEGNVRVVAELASDIIRSQDDLIGFRILLQRSLDLVKRFPVIEPTAITVSSPCLSELQKASSSTEELINFMLSMKIFSGI